MSDKNVLNLLPILGFVILKYIPNNYDISRDCPFQSADDNY